MDKRNAEIVGAGFAGLTAACALAQRGWSVRVHERADRLRTTGAGIYLYENGLRVLEAVGAYEAAVKGAPFAHTREVRDGNDQLISVHRWSGSRVFSVVRQNVINALAAVAARAGVEIVTNSEGSGATADGELTLTDGRRIRTDLVIAADGSNSRLRDGLGLLAKRKYLVDGCTRLLMDKNAAERQATESAKTDGTTMDGAKTDGAKTIEYWSGTRRVLYTPCSETDVYMALTMLDSDDIAKAVPVRKNEWKRAFPHLEALIDRIGEQGRYDRFELIRLKRWSAGRIAVIGDAAHALPPNIGQGGGCAMMNALSLAVFLERENDIAAGLEKWEHHERPLTEHTQRISYFLGLPTTWPPALRSTVLGLAGRSKWLVRQRTRTALHRPTGT
ncbi:MAG: NAD(P)/FAD-dependent oxidoreductase [Xanthobacteraceae bacterium]|jgi:2-polyprenyl-6-methoxyphenol hydroxylase-like FAD-dependent oxidoreductase